MNWTGGALPRSNSGNAKATLTNIQKKHFAKARGKLLNGPRSSPDLDFSALQHAHDLNRLYKERSHSSFARNYRNSLQTQLDDYEQIAPVARKLSSIKPRTIRDRPIPSASRNRRHSFHSAASPRSPSPSYPDPSRTTYESHLRHAEDTARGTHIRTKAVVIEDDLESKRQELLDRQDWVGLANTRPAKIDFTDTKNRHLIGKRRRLEDTERARFAQNGPKRNTIHRYVGPPSSIGDISIRIGDRHHAGNGHSHAKAPSQQGESVIYMIEEVLFNDECVRGQDSKQDINYAQTTPSRSLPQILQRPAHQRLEDSESLQTSWAGFSPPAYDTPIAANGPVINKASSASEIDDTHSRAQLQRYTKTQGPLHDLTHTEGPFEPISWVNIPGLPLKFEDDPQKPIEISSDSSSEVGSDLASGGHHTPEETIRANGKSSELPRNYILGTPKRGIIGPRIPDKQSPIICQPTGHFHEPHEVQAGTLTPKALDHPVPLPEPMSRAPARPALEIMNTKAPKHLESFLATPKMSHHPVSPAKNVSQPTQGASNANNLAEEELIWRNFVFGADTEIMNDIEPTKPARGTESTSNDTTLTTDSSESPGRSSVSVQASNGPVSALTTQLGPSSLDLDSFGFCAPADPSSTESDIGYPSGQAEPALPPSNRQQQNIPQSSMMGQVSVFSSPSRTQQLATSSPDELATTPRQPTFFFKKPSRFVGPQSEVPTATCLGQGCRRRRGRKDDTARADREKRYKGKGLGGKASRG